MMKNLKSRRNFLLDTLDIVWYDDCMKENDTVIATADIETELCDTLDPQDAYPFVVDEGTRGVVKRIWNDEIEVEFDIPYGEGWEQVWITCYPEEIEVVA